MLEIKYIRQNLSAVKRMLEQRSAGVDLTAFEENDRRRRQLLVEVEELRHRRNVVSNRIAEMKKSGEPTEHLLADMRQVADAIKSLEKHLNECDVEVKQLLLGIPNMPHETVPEGKDADDNTVISRDGALPQLDFEAKPHWDVGSRLGIFDFDRASHITGARFPLYLNKGAKLERALIQFMLDVHTEQNSYTEVLPPFIVNRQSMTNTGQLPKFEQDLFKIEGWDYFLIPTAEVPVTNIHQGEILAEEALPIYYTAYSPCFRSEAGSYGKDTRGLIRQHQFNKVELVKFVQPETSYDELEKLLADAVSILTRLELPYQIVNLCTGDLGFSAAKTYDIEVWMPAQGVYREISSCSNFESFQARRANIRYKPTGQKGSRLVHTLNGSGLAVGRTVAAILENFQQADGSVVIPRQLRPYMGNISKLVP